jgi:glycosyltransferase involved in cell wall biosynthesis
MKWSGRLAMSREPVLLSVARIQRLKRLDLAVRALAELRTVMEKRVTRCAS